VKLVVVLIGANNFGFDYCHDDSDIASMFSGSYVAQQRSRVIGAFTNLKTAMANAGYAPGSYTLLAQTYSSPVPNGSGFRYPESDWTRQPIGGRGEPSMALY
jgi:hypothetical protein